MNKSLKGNDSLSFLKRSCNTFLLFCLKPGKDGHPYIWGTLCKKREQGCDGAECVLSAGVYGRRWDSGWARAFPQVSATFAASLVSSPAIGAYLSASYGDSLVVLVATVVALLDICFILLAVPESLPEKMRPLSWGAKISWKQADPFAVNIHFFLQ